MADFNGNRNAQNTAVFKAMFKSLFKKKKTGMTPTRSPRVNISNALEVSPEQQAKNTATYIKELQGKHGQAAAATAYMVKGALGSKEKYADPEVLKTIESNPKLKTAAGIGEAVGTMAQFAVPYGVASKAITSIPKVGKAGEFIGKALTKTPLSEKAAMNLGGKIAGSIATDLAIGVPLNVNYAMNTEELKGSDAAKSIMTNTVLDLVTGGLMESAPAVYRAVKKLKKTPDAAKAIDPTDVNSVESSVPIELGYIGIDKKGTKEFAPRSVHALDIHEQNAFYNAPNNSNYQKPVSIRNYNTLLQVIRAVTPNTRNLAKEAIPEFEENFAAPIARIITGYGKPSDALKISNDIDMLMSYQKMVNRSGLELHTPESIKNILDKDAVGYKISLEQNAQKAYQRAGELGTDMKLMDSHYGNVPITPATKNAEYEYGKTITPYRSPTKYKNNIQSNAKDIGLFDLTTSKVKYANEKNNISKKEMKAYAAIAKMFGIRIELHDNLGWAGGTYGNGVIKISATMPEPIESVFSHELWHHLKKTAVADAEALENFIKKEFFEQDPRAYTKSMESVSDVYANSPKGYDLSDNQMFEEIFANQAHALLYDPKLAQKLALENPNLAQRIVQYVEQFISALKTVYKQDTKSQLFDRLGVKEEALDMMVKTIKSARESVDAMHPNLSLPKPRTKKAPVKVPTTAVGSGTKKILVKKALGKMGSTLDKNQYHFLDFNGKVKVGDLTNFYKVKGEKGIYVKELHPSDWDRRQGAKSYTGINTITGVRISADTDAEVIKLVKEAPARYTPAQLKDAVSKMFPNPPKKKFKSSGIKNKLNAGKAPVAPAPTKAPTIRKPRAEKPKPAPAPTKPAPKPVEPTKPTGKTPTTKKPAKSESGAPKDVILPIVVTRNNPAVRGKVPSPTKDIYTVMKDSDGFYTPYKNGMPLEHGYKDLEDAISDIARDAKITRTNANGNPTVGYRMIGSKKPNKEIVIDAPKPVAPAPTKAPTKEPPAPQPKKAKTTKAPVTTTAPKGKAPRPKKTKEPAPTSEPPTTTPPVTINPERVRIKSAAKNINLFGRKKLSKNIATQKGTLMPKTKHVVTHAIAQGELQFYSKSQKEALANAYAKVRNNAEAAYKEFYGMHAVTDDNVALGYALVDHFQNIGKWTKAANIAMEVSDRLTEAGRAVAAGKMAMRTTPHGRIVLLNRQIKKLQNIFGSRMKGKKIILSDEAYKKLKAATTPAEIAQAMDEAYLEMWNQIPASFYEKMNAFRYTAMLANPKTHIKNILGNLLFAPLRGAKNTIAFGLETAMMKQGTLKVKTQSILTNSPSDKALVKYARDKFEELGGTKMGGSSKFSDSMRHSMSKVFDNKGGELIRRKVIEYLEKEDKLIFEPAYAGSLARFMKANGLTPDKITAEEFKLADEFAIEEALRSTFRDTSWFATLLVRGKSVTAKSKLQHKALAIGLEGIVPFTKTPINILRRGMDYSPIGLMVGTARIIRAAKEGDQIALVKAIDRIASGLTGSGIVALGAYLSSLGVLEGRLPYDSEGNFRKTTGEQGYSLKVGDKSFTIDWLVPFALPLLTGVEMQKNWSEKGFDLGDTFNSIMDIATPVTELSMMAGFTDILNTVQSQEDPSGKAASIGISALTSYAGQFVPTISGQLARTIDPVRRSTASTADSPIERALEKFKNKQIAKIPIASTTLQPFVDDWGRQQGTPLLEEDGTFRKLTGEDAERFFENFLSPTFMAKYEGTAVNKEIMALYNELGDDKKNDVLPKSVNGYTISFSGGEYRLTKEDLANMNKTRGQESLKALNSLINTPEYTMLAPTEKADAISKIYKDAMEKAKTETLIKAGKDPWQVYTDSLSDNQQDYVEVKSTGIDAKTYSELFDGRLNVDGEGNVSQVDAYNYLESTKLTNAQKAVIWTKISGTWKKNPYKGDTISTGSQSGSTSGGRSSKSSVAMGLAQKQVSSYKNLKVDSPELSISQAKALFKMLSTRG